MILLMPMAGEGRRFAEAGYTTPKPYIEISGMPMFQRAAAALPACERQLFISKEKIPAALLPENAINITIAETTAGQAATCLLAKEYINNDEPLVIGACDNGLQYDHNAFSALTKEADAIIFTFRNHAAVKAHPQHYGWVKTEGNRATAVSCKIPISQHPLNDHAITGAFWFAKGKYFVQAAERMIAANRRINNEFYVDECFNDVLAAGLTVKVFEVRKYLGWGTPNDLETYLYWQNYYSQLQNSNASA